ncbi:MAG: nucleotidyl transferase AbiEii/AbiGii toxin family protein, partial [Desulfobacula sp.]|nr:nucleotidyl transferase AbiEii/AbiGii toxin family protein [Desulfobacula sp.]
HIDFSEALTKEKLVELISEKSKEINFSLAKNDVEPFLKNSEQKDELSLWSDAFFNGYLIHEIGVQTDH